MISKKVLVIGDVHLGVNKNNPVFFETALRYAEWIDELCQSRGIDTIIQLGDIFHNREMVHVPAINCAHDFFGKLKNYNIHIIAGNHDCLYNEISDVNSLKLFNNWPNITIHEKVTSIDGICFCGWGTKLADIPDDQRIIFGHFDIKGFEMSANKLSEHGFTASDLMSKCRTLMSGHYHKPQLRFYNKKPLVYAGSAYQLNWGESGEDKYAYILDTESLYYEAIPNKISPRFEYIRSDKDLDKITNNFVSIEVENPEDFASTVTRMKLLNAKDVRTTLRPIKIVPDSGVAEGLQGTQEFQGVNVPNSIDEYVDGLLELTEDEKKIVADTAKQLYAKCI